tara:strand:- start:114 stop:752 length:639 start_codon:yes stop_codon:yes gene_type:complete
MINLLPYEIIENILKKTIVNNSPILSYRLKFVNSVFSDIIQNYNGILSQNICDSENDKYLLLKNANIETLEWFLNKKYNLVHKDISTLILCDRPDILNLLLEYERYKNVLFNRFYLTDSNIVEEFNIFHFGKVNRSYLLLACECNNLNIVKFLLESDSRNVYYLQINGAVDTCLKNKNLKIINYIYNNYKYKIYDKNIERIIEFKKANYLNG